MCGTRHAARGSRHALDRPTTRPTPPPLPPPTHPFTTNRWGAQVVQVVQVVQVGCVRG